MSVCNSPKTGKMNQPIPLCVLIEVTILVSNDIRQRIYLLFLLTLKWTSLIDAAHDSKVTNCSRILPSVKHRKTPIRHILRGEIEGSGKQRTQTFRRGKTQLNARSTKKTRFIVRIIQFPRCKQLLTKLEIRKYFVDWF